MDDLIARVKSFSQQGKLIQSQDRIIVALSGGPDSVFLLDALKELQEEFELRLSALHINHLLRQEESERDEQFCRELCNRWNTPLEVYRVRVREYSRAMRMGIEEGARKLRYHIYSRECSGKKAKVALGHNADDVVETYLFNLIRGGGLAGLSSIPARKDYVIRPLLLLWRSEILDYLDRKNIEFVEDTTNLLHIYTRNKIRHKLIPLMEKFNPQVKKHIVQSVEILSSLSETVKSNVQNLWDDALLYNKPPIVIFTNKIKHAPLAILGGIVKKVLQVFNLGLADFDYKLVKRIKNERGMIDLMGKRHFYCYISSSRIFFFCTQGLETYVIPVNHRGTYDLPGIIGSVKMEPSKNIKTVIHKDETVGYIRHTVGEMVIRSPRRGDYFHPLGAKKKRLSRYFIDKGIPRFLRSFIPLLVIDGKISWVAGCGISEEFKVRQKDTQVLKITWNNQLANLIRRSELWKK